MTQILWSQDVFTKGELSPLMYSRVTLQAYYQGLKTAKNVICFPQGSAGKRFGTVFETQLDPAFNNYKQIYFKSFQYLNECCYILVWFADSVAILLEGELIALVTGTQIQADEISLIDHTILENRFRVTTGIYPPKDLKRSPNLPTAITGFTPSTLIILVANPVGSFYPARFTATTLPSTTPQLHANKTYFIRFITAFSFSIYNTAQEAAKDLNRYVINNAGTLSLLIIQNTWAIANVVFANLPQFDFKGGYDTSTFKPAFSNGYGIALNVVSGPFVFDASYIGGSFRGNGGIGRITQFLSPTLVTIDIVQNFRDTAAIPGKQVLITQNAWSDAQGWPRKCSSFQNRALFANTDTLSNGLWGSVTNVFDDFDDLDTTDDDSAISWFPTSDTVNYIQFIVPYRSLTVHTNSGVYSTPLSVETAITPANFSLALQDSTPADIVQPQGIDNQIIVLSGNDAHSLLWDGFNNAYTSNIISVANEQLIRNPIDEAPYTDRIRAGSRYMFIVNDDGTLAIYQSLIGENVSGFTMAELEQSYGTANFRAVTSNFDGRAWFLTERQIANAGPLGNITSFTSISLTNDAFSFPDSNETAILFGGPILPSSDPQIQQDLYYWAIGVTGFEFKVFLSQADALNNVNEIEFFDIGTSAFVIPYPLQKLLMVEQLSFDAEMDCSGFYPTPNFSPPTSSIPSPNNRFNAQNVLMQGDGFGFSTVGINNFINFIAHGSPVEVTNAQYGFPINVEITPLALSISLTGNPKSSNLVDTKHLKFATFLFADTIGGTITQDNLTFPIALNRLLDVIPGLPPSPQTGKFEISVFGAWDDFTRNSFTINHTEPFGMKLTGIFYKVEV